MQFNFWFYTRTLLINVELAESHSELITQIVSLQLVHVETFLLFQLS